MVRASYTQTICGQCSTTTGQFACVTENVAQICYGGELQSYKLECKPEERCYADQPFPCQKANNIMTPTCFNACTGVCGEENSHICIGPSFYRICSEYYERDVKCNPGMICTINEP